MNLSKQTTLKSGFTLVELLIVVAVLGILAAIVLPEYRNHTQKAKESAAKDNLRILRQAIELYAAQHNGIGPGYPNSNINETPSWPICFSQLLKATNNTGQIAEIGTPGYPLGPYLSEMPANPFNGSKTMKIINNSEQMPDTATGTFGWIYKPYTREIRLDWPGTDSEGKAYYEY